MHPSYIPEGHLGSQQYLSNGSLCEDHTLRSVARLFLCFDSMEFHTGRQAVIKALDMHGLGCTFNRAIVPSVTWFQIIYMAVLQRKVAPCIEMQSESRSLEVDLLVFIRSWERIQ
jgi:hypothetical protein